MRNPAGRPFVFLSCRCAAAVFGSWVDCYLLLPSMSSYLEVGGRGGGAYDDWLPYEEGGGEREWTGPGSKA